MTIAATPRQLVEQLLAQDPASQLLVMQLQAVEPGYCEVTMTVTKQLTNGYQLCHGGFIFTLADSALAFACVTSDGPALSASSSIEFLQPAKLADQLTACARLEYQQGRHCYCQIKVMNQQQQLVALLHARQVISRAKG